MRPVLYILSALAVMGLVFWAYHENYGTQRALKKVIRLQQQIADMKDDLSTQRAEWAYLNRPARLRELALLNFDKLKLLPMTPEQFADVAQIAYPAGVALSQLHGTVATAAATGTVTTAAAPEVRKK